MFKLIINSLPWRGEEYKRRYRAASMQAARDCAEYMADRARFYCPVDSGDLKASIVAVPSLNGTKWNVIATMPYARYVEYGTLHGDVWIKPNPFMRRAFNDAQAAFPAILKGAFVSALPGQSLGTSFSVAA